MQPLPIATRLLPWAIIASAVPDICPRGGAALVVRQIRTPSMAVVETCRASRSRNSSSMSRVEHSPVGFPARGGIGQEVGGIGLVNRTMP
jgi:hypothetical protein